MLMSTQFAVCQILKMEEILHQLMVVYPIIYMVLYIPGGEDSSTNSIIQCHPHEWPISSLIHKYGKSNL